MYQYTLPTLLRLDSSVADTNRNNDGRLTKFEANIAEMDIRLDVKIKLQAEKSIDNFKAELTATLNSELDKKKKKMISE